MVLVLPAACSLQVPRSGSASPKPGSPGASAEIPVATPSPGQSAGAAFDGAHVFAVLAPAVGLIIVNTGGGVSEGSGFVVAHDAGASYMLTNNHVVSGATRAEVLLPSGPRGG